MPEWMKPKRPDPVAANKISVGEMMNMDAKDFSLGSVAPGGG